MDKLQEALTQLQLQMSTIQKENNEKSFQDLQVKMRRKYKREVALDIGGTLIALFSGQFELFKDKKDVYVVFRAVTTILLGIYWTI
jgi:hypothetical protein